MAEMISDGQDVASSPSDSGQPAETTHSAAALQTSGGRRVVVVIGSGRSGTSLCAKILGELGVNMQATLSRPNEMNPEGYFEDREIVEINKRLLEKLSPSKHLPPRGLPLQEVRAEMKALRTYISSQTAAIPGLWGFKDPRVSLLMPYYRRVFQSLGIVPIYIFCARSGSAIVQSLTDVSDTSPELAEMRYFTRSFLALRDCGANCYVLHYERLIESPWAQINKLHQYIFGKTDSIPLSHESVERLVNPALNRSELRSSPLRNALAKRLESLINGMDGDAFDREKVLSEISEINEIYKSYETWLDKLGHELDQARAAAQTARVHRSNTIRNEAATAGSESERAHKREAASDEMVAKLREEIRTATQRTSELEAELETVRLEAEGLRNTNDQLEKAIPDLQSQVAVAQERETTLQNSVNAIVVELSHIRAQNGELEDERNAAVTQARSRLGEVRELTEALSRQRKKHDEYEADAQRRISISAQEVAGAKLESEKARQNATIAIEEAAVAKQQAAAAMREADEVRQQAAIARREVDEHKAALSRLAAAVEEHIQEKTRIVGSVRFRAGKLLVEAVSRPGLNTLALPWRLLRLGTSSAAPERASGSSANSIGKSSV